MVGANEIERLVVTLLGDTEQYTAALSSAVSATQAAVSSMASSLQGAATLVSTAVAAPLAAFGGQARSAAAGFEHSMAKLVGLAGQSKEQVAEWSKQVLDLAPQVGKAPEEMAKGLYFFVLGGLRGADAMEALRLASMASAAGMGEVATIARPIKAAMNAYAESGLTAARATDILTAAVQQSKLDADALAPVIGRIVPLASSVGVAFEEVLGPMAAMTRTGASAAEASVALQAFFSTLLKPAQQSVAVLSQVGLSFEDLRRVSRGENGVINVMQLLKDQFKGNEEAMARVFPNIRALRGVVNLLSQDGKKVNAVLDGVRNSTGALGVAFDAVAGTAVFRGEQRAALLTSGLVDLGQAVMREVAPAMAVMTRAIEFTIGWWRGLDDATKSTIVQYGMFIVTGASVIAGFYAVNAALGLLGVKQLITSALWLVWTGAVLAAKVALAALTFTFVVLKAGYTGALLVLPALTIAFVAAKAATWLWNAALAVMNFLMSPVAILGVLAAVTLLTAGFILAGSAIYAVVRTGADLIGLFAEMAQAEGVVRHIGGLFAEWGGILKAVWQVAQVDSAAAWEILKAGAALAVAEIKDLFPPLWELIKQGFDAAWSFAAEKLKEHFFNALDAAVKGVSAGGLAAVKSLQFALVTGEAAAGKVLGDQTDAAASAARSAEEKLRDLRESMAGFAVPESDSVREARERLEEAKRQAENEAAVAGAKNALAMHGLDENGNLLVAAPPGVGVPKATPEGGFELAKKKRGGKGKDAVDVLAAGFDSAEAQSRVTQFRDNNMLTGQEKQQKTLEEILQAIKDKNKKAPDVEIEDADFEGED